MIGRLLVAALVALPAAARADASPPVAATLSPHCTFRDSPLYQLFDRRADFESGLELVDESDHFLLYTRMPPHRGELLLFRRGAGRTLLAIDSPGAAIVEDRDGGLAGLLLFDPAREELGFRDGKSGAVRWTRPEAIRGDSASAVLDGETLIVATFSRSATGAALAAYDVRTGAPRWRADVEQFNVAHSAYWNDVRLALAPGHVIMRGYEAAGCYLQIFDAATGARRFARLPRPWAR